MRGLDDLTYDANGLIPAIIQDADTHDVLMVAWMNKASLAESLRTGKTHFWSRSRQKQWMKGETSAHTQEIEEIFIDCDADVVLVKARQTGAACHKGYRSCFFRKYDADRGQWDVCAERLFDPDDVYGKK